MSSPTLSNGLGTHGGWMKPDSIIMDANIQSHCRLTDIAYHVGVSRRHFRSGFFKGNFRPLVPFSLLFRICLQALLSN